MVSQSLPNPVLFSSDFYSGWLGDIVYQVKKVSLTVQIVYVINAKRINKQHS